MKKKFFLLIVVFTFGILLFQGEASRANNDSDIFQDILIKTNSIPVEYGVRAIFNINGDKEKVTKELLEKLKLNGELDKKLLQNDKIYCIEFSKNDMNGYIETIQYENHNIVTINITKKNNSYGLYELKNTLKECLRDVKDKVRYFEYVRAKSPNEDIDIINNDILKILKSHQASNINSISIENGYSSTAYTKKYNPIESNGDLIDFNYAVSKYPSGNYIIIGTPEIIITY